MANIFSDIVQKFKDLGDVVTTSMAAAKSKQQAEDVARKLAEAQQKKQQPQEVTSSGNLFKDIATNFAPVADLVLKKPDAQAPVGGIYAPGSQAAKAFESSQKLGQEVREKVGAPLAKLITPEVSVEELRQPKTGNIFKDIANEAQAGLGSAFSTPVAKPVAKTFEYISKAAGGAVAGTLKPEPTDKTLKDIIERQPFLSEVVTGVTEQTPLGKVPYLAPVLGFTSEFLLPPYGGALGKTRLIKQLTKEGEETAVKSLIKKGIKDVTEEEASILARKLAPIKNEKLVQQELEQFAKSRAESKVAQKEVSAQLRPAEKEFIKTKGIDADNLSLKSETATANEIFQKLTPESQSDVLAKAERPTAAISKSKPILIQTEKGIEVLDGSHALAGALKENKVLDFYTATSKVPKAPLKVLFEEVRGPKAGVDRYYQTPHASVFIHEFEDVSGKKFFSAQKISGENQVLRPQKDGVIGGIRTIENISRNTLEEAQKDALKLSKINKPTKEIGIFSYGNKELFSKIKESIGQTPAEIPSVRRPVAPDDTAVRPEPPALPKEKFPVEATPISKATEFSDSYKKLYHNSDEAVSESAKIETTLNPTEAGGQFTPEKAGLFQRFKEKAGNAWTATREFIEDDMVRVKKLIQDPGAKVTEASDPYQAEILFHGRIGARIEEAKQIVDDIDKDIIQTAKKLDVPDAQLQKDVDRYLHARHAPERNSAIGPGAAGMFTDEANAIIKEIESSATGAEVKRIADKLQDLNNKTLDVLLEGEVIDRKLYDTLRERYKNHVPLNRVFENTEDVGSAIAGRPFDVKSTGIKRATGSLKRPVADITTNIVSNYEQALIRAEKNRVDLATLKFARDNKALGLFEEIKPKPIGKTFEGGIITERITDPQTLVLREAGKPVYLKINDPHIAAALRGVNRHKVDGILRAVQAITRFYSGLATRFNPEFAFPNKIRDLQEAIVYMSSKGEFKAPGAVKAAIRDPISMKDVVDALRGKNSEGARLYRQMQMDGGTTGGIGLSTRAQVELDINKIRKLNRSNPAKAAEAITKYVDAWNTIWEDSTRLSVYREALKQGASRSRAAVLAKEASVNFNKFGKGGPVLNALYMFSNASIQGSAKMLRAMRNPKVAGTVIAAVGAATATVNEWNDFVDPEWREKVTKWDRMNSLSVMIPTKDGGVTYISVPVSWGMKPIKVMMDYALDALDGKGKGVADAMSGTLAAIVDAYNPAGGTDLMQSVTPTILDLPVDIARNRAWSGAKIRPDWDQNAPGSIQYFSSLRDTATGRTFVGVAKGLSHIGMEVSPADINYAYENIIGGAGRATSKFLNTIGAVAGGELPPAREIPFVSRFVRQRDAEQVGAGSTEFEDVKAILADQSRSRFVLKQNAEDAYQQLKNIPKDEAAQRFDEIKAADPQLAQEIRDIIKEEEIGLTYTERLIKQLGVENGERARYLKKKFDELPTKEQKAAAWSEYKKKGIITTKVADQLKYLFNQP